MTEAPHRQNTRTKVGFLAQLCCAFALLGGAVASGAEGEKEKAEPKPVVLQLHRLPQSQFAGYLVAKEKGFFREAGLPNVKVEWWTGGDPPVERVLHENIEFCTGRLAQMIPISARGRHIVNIAQIVQKSAGMLVTHRASGILKPADMAGRRVGLWGGGRDVQAEAFFKKFGVEPKTVLQSDSMVPFLCRALDVASATYYDEYHKLLEAGARAEDLQIFPFADYGMNFPEDGIYCTAATRQFRSKECLAIVSASIKGWAYALAHEAEALDVVMKYCYSAHMLTSRNHQRWMLRAMAELIQHRVGSDSARWGTLRREDYDRVAKVLLEQRAIAVIPFYDLFHKPALSDKGGNP